MGLQASCFRAALSTATPRRDGVSMLVAHRTTTVAAGRVWLPIVNLPFIAEA
jgi:hypothetical protein